MFIKNLSDEEIKKRWFAWNIISAVLGLITGMVYQWLMLQETDVPAMYQFAVNQSWLVFSLTAVPGLLIVLALYYWAYKKPGTRLLTFLIVMRVLSYLKVLPDLVALLHSQIGTFMAVLFAVDLFNAGIWFWLSLKVREINKKQKALLKQAQAPEKVEA